MLDCLCCSGAASAALRTPFRPVRPRMSAVAVWIGGGVGTHPRGPHHRCLPPMEAVAHVSVVTRTPPNA